MKFKKKIKQTTENKVVKVFIQIFATVLGSFIMGIAFRNFYTPHSITPTGFSGLAIIISELLSRINIILSPSIIYVILNVIIFIIALRYFGWKFGLLTLVGILSLSAAMEYFYIDAIVPKNDLLLSCFIGGALLGIGGGIVFRFGGSTGGSDIVQLLINKFNPRIRTGTCGLIVNLVVLTVSIFVYGINLALYAVVSAFVYSKTTDIVLEGTKAARAFYIICDKDNEIAEKILTTFHRGVTRVNVEGVFSRKPKKLLICIMPNHQGQTMKNIIKEIDPKSFVYSSAVREAMGESMFMKEEALYKEMDFKKFLNLKKKQPIFKAKLDAVTNPIVKQPKKINRCKNKMDLRLIP